jgi:hypothetical protein
MTNILVGEVGTKPPPKSKDECSNTVFSPVTNFILTVRSKYYVV